MSKVVVITGVSGQDGSYMAEYCLALGHQVYAVVRRTAQIHDLNFKHLLSNPNFVVLRGDLLDSGSIDTIVQDTKPNYFINFAAQSFVGDSWKIPEETFMVGAVGVLKCLEAIRRYAPACRFYNAGSSEQFGDVIVSPQNETHPFRPRSVYGAAKCAAHHLVKVYRESYHLYAVQGILFNHESERRGEEFVTRKITKGVARIKVAMDRGEAFAPIELGNLQTKRDWSHAEDFVDGVWRMLNQDKYNNRRGGILLPFEVQLPFNIKDYVLSSNETHTIAEFLELAFKHAGIEALWLNGTSPFNENRQLDLDSGRWDHERDMWCYRKNAGCYPALAVINKKFYRPAEVEVLHGDSSLARKELGWNPKISFDNLVKRMVTHDLQCLGIDYPPSM